MVKVVFSFDDKSAKKLKNKKKLRKIVQLVKKLIDRLCLYVPKLLKANFVLVSFVSEGI